MNWNKATLQIATNGKGLYSFEREVQQLISKWGVIEGMCYLYLPHTSASLIISENYDPTARRDLEEFMNRFIPENQPWFTHTLEGADDATSHIRAMITNSDLVIPMENGRLCLGTWQGIFLFEHRQRRYTRNVFIRCLAVQ
ncbi:MAG: YjbQ family protein [Anaerolineales bacterium]|nr:YjbQ family protein [Anaerolineales bacterium]